MSEQVIKLSQNAAERIKDIMSKAEEATIGVRVGVKSGGCAGMSYIMEYAKDIKPNEEVIEDKGVKVLITGGAGFIGSHLVESLVARGQKVVVIDDVATTGSSIEASVLTLRDLGLEVYDAIVAVDRVEGASERLRRINVRLHSILKAPQILSKGENL